MKVLTVPTYIIYCREVQQDMEHLREVSQVMEHHRASLGSQDNQDLVPLQDNQDLRHNQELNHHQASHMVRLIC